MTTRYHARTEVERWQLQDRLALRLRRLGYDRRPRFFEAGGGRLAFRLWMGWRPQPDVADRLSGIDEPGPEAEDAARREGR